MRKRILSLVLCLLIVMTTLTGCYFIEHNYVDDYRQIITTINITDGDFESGDVHIYKYELMEAVNEAYESNQTAPTEASVYSALDQLILEKLIYIEIDRLFDNGTLEWRGVMDYNDTTVYDDYTDSNIIKKAIFSSIDSELVSLANEILVERGEVESNVTSEEEVLGEPTYPTRDEEVDEEVYPEPEQWTPDDSSIPGKYVDADKISLQLQALERFTVKIVELVESGYAEWDQDLLDEAEEEFNTLIESKEHEKLYTDVLYKSYPIEFLIKESAVNDVKVDILETYLTDGTVDISASQVNEEFQNRLNEQKLLYNADVSNYVSALSGTDQIYYRPNSDYFYVKHILLPFSDSQTAQLTAYQENPANKDNAEGYVAYRDSLVNEIVVYPHLNGYDDYSNPTTVSNVMTEVYSKVNSASGVPSEAEAIFDDYIYLYNTDPGAFTNTSGYAIKKVLYEGEYDQFMEEFAEIGRELYFNYSVGQVCPEYAVTDYGVHIMYYASDAIQGEVNLYDYTNSSKTDKIFDVIHDEMESAEIALKFNAWQQEKIVNYLKRDDIITKYDSRFSDIYDY